MTRNDEPDGADLGALERSGDREVTLRFTRRLPHPPAKVWRALTEPAAPRGLVPDDGRGRPERRARPLRYGFREMQPAGLRARRCWRAIRRGCWSCDWGDERLRFELVPADA